MKRPRRGAKSLRAKLFALCFAVILVMALLCGGVLISEHRAIASLSDSLSTIDSFYRFDSSLSSFQQQFNLYANSLSRQHLRQCHLLLQALTDTSRDMASNFPQEASIAKNQALIEDYVAASTALLAEGSALTEPEFWSRYDENRLMLSDINENARRVQSFYLENISQLSARAMASWRAQLRLSLLVALISLALLLLFVNRFISSVTAPVLRLVQYAGKIAGGDFSQPPPPPARAGSDEISLLSDTFAAMAKTIDEQMCALRDKIDLAKRLHALEIQNMNIRLCLAEKEMNLMQSMINPHFLFNSLGTVSSMAVLENAPQTQALAIKIARYLRASIDLVGARIDLRREIELLRQYLYIQSVRLGERIAAGVQCEKACEKAVVPALFLQPIVENAIVHGLGKCVAGGRIEVAAALEKDGRVCVRVTDNGRGMESDRLAQLLKAIRAPFRNGQNCVGLHSVISQLDLLFGQNYAFDIQSAPGQGAAVRILLPLLAEDGGPMENPPRGARCPGAVN